MSKSAIIKAVTSLDLAETARLLDTKPALLTVTARNGQNLLHLACSVPPGPRRASGRRAASLADLLLDRGLPIDEPVGPDACTPLFFAVARARDRALVKRLLARGADVTAAPGGGLFAAGWWEDLDTLDLLIDAGAPVDVVVGVTPFLACWCWRRFDAARRLAARGANVNVQDGKGRTALHHGVEKNVEPARLAWLVTCGASPDIADHDGVSARVKASRKRDRRYLAALG